MSDPVHRSPEDSTGSDFMSPAEKLACEWEARHDVAARGGRIDPAAALQHYISHSRCEQERYHRERHAPRSREGTDRHGKDADEFRTQHPFVASWVRWGEDPR